MDWGRMSRAERDAAYNNSAAVADSATLNAARVAASEAVRAAADPEKLDLMYGTAERQRWDLFPAADPAAPCLVFIHGGYWQRNSREGFSVLADGVRAHGWAAALPSHTLAPDATLSEIVAEIGQALDWLAAHGPAHGIAGRKIISGWSAGGHLAAMWLGHPSIAAGMAISGVFELGPLRDTYLDEKLRLHDDEILSLSPLRLPPVQKPLAIAYGTAELFALVGNSRDFHAHRAAAHAPGPLLPVAGADHFSVLDALRDRHGALTAQVRLLAEASF
jgi:acetyl esterase/lipase